jgi:hypothetical protein
VNDPAVADLLAAEGYPYGTKRPPLQKARDRPELLRTGDTGQRRHARGVEVVDELRLVAERGGADARHHGDVTDGRGAGKVSGVLQFWPSLPS